MMHDTLRAEVEQIILSEILSVHPTVKFATENMRIEQPDTPWMLVEIEDTHTAKRANIGTRKFWRRTGVMLIVVLNPENNGTALINNVLDTVDDVFGERTVTTADNVRVIFKIPRVTAKGLNDGFYWRQIAVDFYHDECRN